MRYFNYMQPIFSDDGTGTILGDEIIVKSEEDIRGKKEFRTFAVALKDILDEMYVDAKE